MHWFYSLLFSRYLLLLPRITLNVLSLLISHQTPLFFLLYCHFFGLALTHTSHSSLATFASITEAPNLCFNTPNTCNYSFNIVEIFSSRPQAKKWCFPISICLLLTFSCSICDINLCNDTNIVEPTLLLPKQITFCILFVNLTEEIPDEKYDDAKRTPPSSMEKKCIWNKNDTHRPKKKIQQQQWTQTMREQNSRELRAKKHV